MIAGVVAPADEDGQELGAGTEVGAGFPGGLHAAVDLRRAGAQAVAKHESVGLAAQAGYAAMPLTLI